MIEFSPEFLVMDEIPEGFYRINRIPGYKPWRGGVDFVTKEAFDYFKSQEAEVDNFYEIPAPEGYSNEEDEDGLYDYLDANIIEAPQFPYLLAGELTFYVE